MKYILEEKFILNENIPEIKTPNKVLAKILDDLNTKLTSQTYFNYIGLIISQLNKTDSSGTDKLNSAKEDLQLLEKERAELFKKGLVNKKARLANFLKSVKAFATTYIEDIRKTALPALFNEIGQKAKNINTKQLSIKAQFEAPINKIFNELSSLYSARSLNLDALNKESIKATLINFLQMLGDRSKYNQLELIFTPEVIALLQEEENITPEIIKYIQSINNLFPSEKYLANQVKEIETNPKALVSLTNLFNTALEEYPKAAKKILDLCGLQKSERSAKEKANGDGRAADWDTMYNNLNPLDSEASKAFWSDYYNSYWGNNADYIKSLGNSFIIEVEAKGFTELTNPFITYIKRVLIEKNVPIKVETYNAIHDAYLDNRITDEDLKNSSIAKNKVFLGEVNIINSPDLFTYSYDNILEYLDLQWAAVRQINDASKNESSFKNDILNNRYKIDRSEEDTAKTVFIKTFMTDLFYAPGNLMSTKAERDSSNSGDLSGKLNSLSDIKIALQACFAVVTDTKEGKEIPLSITDIEPLIDTTADARDIISYLITTTDPAYFMQAVEKYPSLSSHSAVLSKDFATKKAVKLNKFKVTKKDLPELIQQIANRMSIK